MVTAPTKKYGFEDAWELSVEVLKLMGYTCCKAMMPDELTTGRYVFLFMEVEKW